jgi:endonuclease/exonuclease/phosphatase family metal-dependent hydrolase
MSTPKQPTSKPEEPSSKTKPIYKRKYFVLLMLAVLAVIIVDLVLVFATHGTTGKVNVVTLQNDAKTIKSDQVTVLTINMAHGRSDGRNQIFQSSEVIEKNVTTIGNLIAREKAQVVALQEADAPSWWSGRFSHVNKVGSLGGMTSAVQGQNVDGLGLHYGAALVTQLKVTDAHQVTFARNVPTFSKGFVVATCTWPGDSSFKFDVVSVHLDFASSKVRASQMKVLAASIKKAARPVIVMGDFNTNMSEKLLPDFLKTTRLSTWKPNDESIVTFPLMDSRIDWILVSQEFNIVQQAVLDDVVSDHRAVRATIRRNE